jgi:hypothetical protein
MTPGAISTFGRTTAEGGSKMSIQLHLHCSLFLAAQAAARRGEKLRSDALYRLAGIGGVSISSRPT